MITKERKKNQKTLQGRVVSDKMSKTRTLLFVRRVQHPLFKKSMIRSRKVKFHDEKNESKEGDLVKILETRPLSRDKRHKLINILERAK